MAEPITERPEMQGYGVDPGDPDGLLPWSWAEERLERSRSYWLVTVAASGTPHCLPVWAVWLRDPGELWFSCAPSSRKAANIAANPAVVVAVDGTVEVVSIEGTATREEHDDPAAARAAQAYAEKYETDPVRRADLVDFIGRNDFYRVAPVRGFGIIEDEALFSRSATRWRWPR
jgi:hypothetical protein